MKALTFLAAIVWSSSAWASIDVQSFYATHSPRYSLIDTVWSPPAQPTAYCPQWLRYGPVLDFQFHTVDSPLVITDAFGTTTTSVISRLSTIDIGVSAFVSEPWQLAIDTSLNAVAQPSQGVQFALGDLRLLAKHRLLTSTSGLTLGVIPNLTIPTGNASLFLSSGYPAFGVDGTFSYDFGPLLITGVAGYLFAPGALYANLNYAQQIRLGAGAAMGMGPSVSLSAELLLKTLPLNGFALGPGDFYAGANVRIFNGGHLYGGVGFAPIDRASTSSFRIVAGLKAYPPEPQSSERVMIHDCGDRPMSMVFEARPVTAEEKAHLKDLPYRDTHAHKLPVLDLGQPTGQTPTGAKYVKDSQVLFAIDIFGLPPRKALVALRKSDIKLDVTKVSRDAYTDTEMICFLEQGICSGEPFSKGEWKENINPDFFHGKETPNDYFSRQYLAKKIGEVDGQRIYSAELTLEINKLLENSPIDSAVSLFYDKTREDPATQKRTLYFVVADDTFVSSSARISVMYVENSCETTRRSRTELSP